MYLLCDEVDLQASRQVGKDGQEDDKKLCTFRQNLKSYR